jgi:L-iditol 2-dehydrogenase
MLAAVFERPNHISVSSVPAPGGPIKLKVKASAICGYDVRVFRNGHRKVTPPVILGHEICGELSDPAVTKDGRIEAGTRVAVYPQVPCLRCYYCEHQSYNLCVNLRELGSTLNGGFAEFVDIPEQLARIGGLVPIPDSLSDEEAALLEPLACSVNSLSRLDAFTEKFANDRRPIVIIGDGPLGLMHLQLFKHLSPERPVAVVGRIPSRMKIARSLSADRVVEYTNLKSALEELATLAPVTGFGIVIVATSNPKAVELAISLAGKSSVINMFAGMPDSHQVQFASRWLHYNQVSITASFGSTPPDLSKAKDLASAGHVRLAGLVTGRFAIAEVEKAILETERYNGLRSVINKF